MSHYRKCEAERDLEGALARLRYVCAMHDIPCPDVLSFSTEKEGYKAYRVYQDLIPPWSASRPQRWVAPSLGMARSPGVQIQSFTVVFEPLLKIAADYYTRR